MVKILLVDDDAHKSQNIESIVREVLTDKELDLTRAVNISEANKALNVGCFDLMLLDLNLPMRDGSVAQSDAGIKFLYQLGRKDNMSTPTHIIGLTSFDQLLAEHQKHFKERGWVLVRYKQDSQQWEKVISEKIYHILHSSHNKKWNWFLGLKYPLIFVSLLLILLLVYVFLGFKGFVVLVSIVIMVFYVTCLFQLRSEEKLTEQNFIALNIEVLKIIKSKLLDAWSVVFGNREE